MTDTTDKLVEQIKADRGADSIGGNDRRLDRVVEYENRILSDADRIEGLEAKLAMAAEFAEVVERCGHGVLWNLARETLAELKGQDG